ncbi:MAG: pyruvate kinase [Endomicrobium sp.]|nr:pyruvate kinase [Endomicrobium sp.]
MKQTGIICTMGPSIRSVDILLKMFNEGMKIVRFNFSHGTFNEYEKDFALIKSLYTQYNVNLQTLVDLEGHRIRIGKLQDKQIKLKVGQKLILTNQYIVGNHKMIYIDYKYSFTDIKVGHEIFIDDGNLTLLVLESKKENIITEVCNDYLLKEYKGVNIPTACLQFNQIEQRDVDSVKFALKHHVNFIANSFVRSDEDMKPLLDILKQENIQESSCKLIAKIEDQAGIDNLHSILKVTDGVMVARGDLGISIPIWKLPIKQKYIIKECKNNNKFVIVATQILESMITKMTPTRAEVNDIANAVLDGADYVMFSAETAVGKYPIRVVKIAKNVINYTIKEMEIKWK